MKLTFAKSGMLVISTVACLAGCIKTMPPLVNNDDTAPTMIIISKPNHTWKVQGNVVKLEPDENGCLIRKRMPTESLGGSYKHILRARPGDIVAVAMATDYSVSTKLPCKVAYAFKVEPGYKRYEMGSTGTCATFGFAMPAETGNENMIKVVTTQFSYPMMPSIEADTSGACIKAPAGIFGEQKRLP